MMTSQLPSSAALPAKQRPETTPMVGTLPFRSPKRWNVVVSSPAGVGHSSPGRPPPPSANTTTGSAHLSASVSRRSFFLWLVTPCVPANTV